ncbi:hypothetical protein FHS16_000363 [Paenibacillus endophyticus]|uniref:Uncharacterized protein n=1 Tax=Paenibacillus endophyticus TaxID=1294268 RepID=A0A7W5C334_9BACL|nr:hypothetical protein [Paenibacillus endophyticus]MBB3150331.1 hypothetical protein [Paenibacillus endophyticus]
MIAQGMRISSRTVLVETELFQGANGRLQPKGGSTRKEAALLLHRMYNQQP